MLDRFNEDNNFIRLMSLFIRITQLMETHADAHILELNFR